MDTLKKMNILVLGASGAGKSTLIRAVSGAKINIGVGKGRTQKIDVYESDNWPLRFIDTKGFEYKRSEQRKTIRQIKEYTKKQVENTSEAKSTKHGVSTSESEFESKTNDNSDKVGIDAVWYCIEGTSRRTFEYNISLMNKAIKGWKNVPVFAVITKSYSTKDIGENVQAVAKAFSRARRVNLQQIIPVVAEEFAVDDEVIVAPMGLSELCIATLDCADAARQINEENRARMIVEQKRHSANTIVGTASAAATIIGAVPFNFADAAILVPLETMLTKSILKVYSVKFSGELITAIVGSSAITNIAKAAITPLKALPIAGSVINGVVAGGIVLALGQSEIAACEAIHTGKLNPQKIQDIVKFIEEQTKDSPVIGDLVKYLEDHSSSLTGKNAKQIFKLAMKALKLKNKI